MTTKKQLLQCNRQLQWWSSWLLLDGEVDGGGPDGGASGGCDGDGVGAGGETG